nr:MAG TPA: hypothetical protein [Caudoviricetes sp.]
MSYAPRSGMLKSIRYPCYGCRERNLYCHVTCEKYLALKKERLEMKAKIKRKNMKHMFIEDYEIKEKLKNLRRKPYVR